MPKKKYDQEKIWKALVKAKGNYFLAAKDVGMSANRLWHFWEGCKGQEVYNDKPKFTEIDAAIKAYYETGRVQLQNFRTQTANTSLRKSERIALATADLYEELIDEVRNLKPIKPAKHTKPKATKKEVHVEALLSDVHWGMATNSFNSKIATARVNAYSGKLVEIINKEKATKVTINICGDLINNAQGKHSSDVGGSDMTTSEEVVTAFCEVAKFLEKIYRYGCQDIQVVFVCGNHSNWTSGSKMSMAGRTTLDYIIGMAIKKLCKDFIPENKWIMPDGNFALYKIGDKWIGTDHGCGVKVSEASLSAQRAKRMTQTNKVIHSYRTADKHSASVFDHGRLIVNGSAIGQSETGEEFSSAKGYAVRPSQVVVVWEANEISHVYIVKLGE